MSKILTYCLSSVGYVQHILASSPGPGEGPGDEAKHTCTINEPRLPLGLDVVQSHPRRREYQPHRLRWVDWEIGHVLVYLAHGTAYILYHSNYEYTINVEKLQGTLPHGSYM